MAEASRIGLALSGGGSRAIAFHLGCMRALHDRGVLDRVSVLSAVSGGSVVAAMWAYTDVPFDEFDRRVTRVLRHGLVWGIARHTLLSPETLRIVGTLLTSGLLHVTGVIVRWIIAFAAFFRLRGPRLRRIARSVSAPMRRFYSRTTAFERYLRLSFFGDVTVDQVARPGVSVVINATELRTGTAFRFGSGESGTWRLGRLVDPPHVARAVAASAAFPALLPSFDLDLEFRGRGAVERHRVIVTDGGVYDNLGISCMLPGRSSEFSTNAHTVDFIISCDAGQGIPSGDARPYSWAGRMLATVNTIHRRTHTQAYDLLHRMAANREIGGFLLPYLGQIDARLPHRPDDLVPREAVMDYPTDFSPMSADDIDRLSRRGEQLTAVLLDHYAPHL
ncbi:patatin-like phospholipase family protein [Sphingobium yanoikuyae]|uniref:patatin-like phospholipase family protein n=1 Tax=Sphingobium yanoikuyae TaxID=13690 RepID=UPI000262B5A6|nr:patatin-like phospholipase family protein [Sphingobium yanoikuyae]